ncbi:two-component sensor histidine kinase [Bacillus pseudomycoides]|uniref:sensor histidine kinase n=1 Tax=Bacillus pseudomycoides TaxID=64104 RepID=UPI000BF38D43|nr:sensor histidine kinase [Bacillus pseudomycoides]PFZ11911.1 two-component sensor histidine kinase [Bacillus pseudomycoides]
MRRMTKFRLWRLVQQIRTSLRLKLLTCFLVVALIPLMLFSWMSYEKSSNLVNEQFGDYGKFAISQLQTQIELTLSHMHLIASDIQEYLSDPTLIVLKKEAPKSYSEFIIEKNFERFLEAHKTAQTKGIFLITPSGYYYGDRYLDVQKLKKEKFWEEQGNLSQGYWNGIYVPNHYSALDKSKVIGLLVPVKTSFGSLKDSRILVETDATDLFKFIDSLETDLHALITIRNEKKQVIYTTDENYKKNKDDIIWEKPIPSNKWSLEIIIPEKEFYQSSTIILFVTLIGIVVSLCLAFMLAFLISAKLTENVTNLDHAISQVSKGDFYTNIPVNSQDEVGNLTVNFNKMVVKIKSLVEEIYEKEKLKKDAELKAIHYQINPHFLFNTLNSIQWKAKLQGANDVSEMIYHLVAVLEGNLNFANDLVTLQSELTIIEHYLKVQEIRFGNYFSYTQNVPSSMKEEQIPRMSLQPIFENIFFHAFDDGEGAITLSAFEKDNGDLCIHITDDGRGISDRRKRDLLQEPSAEQKGGLGLYNIDQKFKLHFGIEYGLTIQSEEKKGTIIQILWPKGGIQK